MYPKKNKTDGIDVKAIDKDSGISNNRVLTGFWGECVKWISLAFSAYNIYIAVFGIPGAMYNRPTHLMLAMLLVFLTVKARKSNAPDKVYWYDIVLCILCITTSAFILIKADWFMSRWSFVTPLTSWESLFGAILILLILEMGRRAIGLAMPIISGAFLLYGYFGYWLPPPFGHIGFSPNRIFEQLYMTLDGIWSSPLYITATYVALFIFFGTLLAEAGMGDFFADIATSLSGHTPGGSAKTAVISSGLMGMISGSTVANVVTTGAVTIPMMKKSGFKPQFAAAVEAVASTGGQYMPPVMGAAAFIMAEFMGIPYSQIVRHAIIPAVLYFVAAFFAIDFRSRKMGMKPVPKESIPNFWNVLKKQGYMLLPIIIITAMVMMGYTPMRSCLLGILSVVVILLLKDWRSAPKVFYRAMLKAPKSIITVTAACANAGIIIGVITMTGLGLRISSIVMAISGGHLAIAILFSIIIAILLGMGMPSSGAYVIMATLLAPGLISLGVPKLQTHFFLFYFTGVSAITPPVAIASYAAAGLAGSDPMKTGFTAFRLGIAAYIIPMFFILSPALLMEGTVAQVAVAIITSLIGVYALAASMEGWFLGTANFIVRAIMLAVALLCIDPGAITDTIGLALLAIAIIIQMINKKRAAAGVAGNVSGKETLYEADRILEPDTVMTDAPANAAADKAKQTKQV